MFQRHPVAATPSTGARSESYEARKQAFRPIPTTLLAREVIERFEGTTRINTTEAPIFTPLLMHDAPLASRPLLEQAHRYFGFVPNLIATMAHSPSALRVYLNANLGFQHGTLTPGEQQIVLLAASKENACRYCTTSHSALARFFANVPGDAIVAIENDRPLSDPKLNALTDLTRQLVSQRGYVQIGRAHV